MFLKVLTYKIEIDYFILFFINYFFYFDLKLSF
jgi:hypothetical protein